MVNIKLLFAILDGGFDKKIKNLLNKFGINVEEYDNEVVIKKQVLQNPTEILKGHNDHRIVMALSVLLTLTGGYIEDEEAVKKSYPTFFEDLKQIGIEVRQC